MESGVIDLGARFKGEIASLEDLITRDAIRQVDAQARNAPSDYALADVVLEKPLSTWGKCFCVGVNYPDRNAEYKDGSDAPKYPSLFVRFPESLVGSGASILRPKESEQLDYEGEIVLVIGKRGRRISARGVARARLRIHDRQRGHPPRLGSARQIQRHAGQELGGERLARPLDRSKLCDAA